MSVRRLDPNQPKDFKFTPENLAWARAQIGKYPEGREQAAVLPILWRAQEQNDYWLPEPAIRYVADLLGMPYIRVYEIATFYTMFNLSPVGRYHVQLCGTTPCMLRGANELKAVCEEVIGPQGRVTPEGVFSWVEVECLGACVNAPMAQINKDYYEDLTPENFRKLLDDLRRGRTVKTGPQTARQLSAPASGPKTLTDPAQAAYPAGTVWPEAAARGEEARQDAAQAMLERVSPVKVPDRQGGEARPAWALDKPEGGAGDDLTRIAGIGPDIERLLNDMGVYHYRQIAGWSDKDVEWVGGRLRFDGTSGVRDWVVRAKSFAATDRAGQAFAGAEIAVPADGKKT
jgi:NADH-quinone oxidoreductase subunit E